MSPSIRRPWGLFALLMLSVALSPALKAQTTQAIGTAGLGPLKDGWEEIDQRFMFLTVELSSVEASINSVNKALHLAGYQRSRSQEQADNYAAGNSLMDRRGGGPVAWQDFYGKTAQNFYYHASGNLDAHGPVSDLHIQVTGKDLTPVDRPPQFDFIYRANADAQARAAAETAALGTKIDQLLARRRQLEAEQSALWLKISLRGLSSRDLSDKPSYRFEPQANQTDDRSEQRLVAVAAACKFMRIINTLVKQAQPALDHDQGYVYAQLHQGVALACDELRTVLLSQPTLYEELDDSQSELGRFNRAARHLEDSAQNLVDAYRLAGDGDRAGDDQRKDSFRGQLQESAIDFTETVITADRVFTAIIHDWKVLPDISRPVPPESKVFIAPTTAPSPSEAIDSQSSATPVLSSAADAQIIQPTNRAPGPVIATSVLFTVDDFVIDVFQNGVKVPDSKIHLDGEIFGATVFRIDVKVHRNDWLVFNVVNDRFRWGGAYGFAAAGLKGGKTPVFETTADKGSWSACDAPDQALRFIHDPTYLSDKSVVIPGKPWSGCTDQMKARCDWDGETVWSDSESKDVWIKYIVP